MNASTTAPCSNTSRRREREKQHRRQAILNAAERVFAVHGFHGASVDKIAQEAQYAPGTLYLYFKDKDALYSALFFSKLTQMVDQVEQAGAAAADPLEGIRNSLRAQFKFDDRNREFFEVFTHHRMTEQAGQAEEWKNVHETVERHHVILTRLIERAQRKKQLRAGNSNAFAVALLGIVMHMNREKDRHRIPSADEADFVFELFVNGARRAPSSK